MQKMLRVYLNFFFLGGGAETKPPETPTFPPTNSTTRNREQLQIQEKKMSPSRRGLRREYSQNIKREKRLS